jgi:Fe-S oxidoreductase
VDVKKEKDEMKVSMFITCFNDTLFPETERAVVTLLERLGYEIDFPEEQTCCGQMHYNTGYQREALPLIRHFLQIFGSSEVVVAPSASCAGMMRDIYPRAALRDVPAGEQPQDVVVARDYRRCETVPREEVVKRFVERVAWYRVAVQQTGKHALPEAIATLKG